MTTEALPIGIWWILEGDSFVKHSRGAGTSFKSAQLGALCAETPAVTNTKIKPAAKMPNRIRTPDKNV